MMKDSKKPRIWKMMLIAWVFSYIMINLFFAVVGPFIQHFHPLLRSIITTTLFVPLFGLGIPALQRKLHKWTVR